MYVKKLYIIDMEALDKKQICKDYTDSSIGVESLALKYHVGKLKIKAILSEAGIPIKKRGNQNHKERFIVNDWKIDKYPIVEGKHYIAIDKNNGFKTLDFNNKAGVLTTHIKKEYGVVVPTLYDRRKYYMRTGNYWWEQWFDIRLVENKQTKKCPYCGWETVDVENKSGVFECHLLNEHGVTVEEYVKEYPNELDYFNKYKTKLLRETKLLKDDNHVVCPYCGQKYEKLTEAHLISCAGISMSEFRKIHPGFKILSNNMYNQTMEAHKLSNLTVSKNRFISKYEKEIQDYLTNHGVTFEPNRQILIGKEIDILIEDKKIGIEFDGLKFHTEFFGKKSHGYHLEKTIKCNEKGYGLIHVFEDEYVNHKDIVLSKIGHALGFDKSLPKIGGRCCDVKHIIKSEAEIFLNKYHIQGFASSTCYYGAYYKKELVCVMCFKHGNLKSSDWELTRFASNSKYQYQGVASKMFKHFIKEHNPDKVISFADRRWTLDMNSNLYTKIGFQLETIGRPDYRYYNEKVNRYERIHKTRFMKSKLIKKYGFPESMTEWEMARELGYDRIWDCGLIKYVYKK